MCPYAFWRIFFLYPKGSTWKYGALFIFPRSLIFFFCTLLLCPDNDDRKWGNGMIQWRKKVIWKGKEQRKQNLIFEILLPPFLFSPCRPFFLLFWFLLHSSYCVMSYFLLLLKSLFQFFHEKVRLIMCDMCVCVCGCVLFYGCESWSFFWHDAYWWWWLLVEKISLKYSISFCVYILFVPSSISIGIQLRKINFEMMEWNVVGKVIEIILWNHSAQHIFFRGISIFPILFFLQRKQTLKIFEASFVCALVFHCHMSPDDAIRYNFSTTQEYTYMEQNFHLHHRHEL